MNSNAAPDPQKGPVTPWGKGNKEKRQKDISTDKEPQLVHLGSYTCYFSSDHI